MSSSACRQLVVNTNLLVDGHVQSASLLRSLSAQNAQLSPGKHRLFSTPADNSVFRDPPAPAARQMSCPEPSGPRQATAERADFTTEELELNKWLSCVVSYVSDPENFYCQLSSNDSADRLESLMSRIDTYVTSLPPGIGKLRTATLGQPVIAKYSEDSTWYRARVTGLHPSL